MLHCFNWTDVCDSSECHQINETLLDNRVEPNSPSEQDSDIVVVRMRFILWIDTQLPLTEAGQRIVGVVTDLQVRLLHAIKNKLH